MNRILILTKNISVDTHLQKQLQKLNYEVLISVSLWDHWDHSRKLDNFIQAFQLIFLSETISNEEAKEFGKQLRNDCLIRIVGEVPSESTLAEWSNWYISDWIMTNASLERLREKLIYKHQVLQNEFINDHLGNYPMEQRKLIVPIYFSDIHFTKLEKEIIHRLIKAKNLSLRRDALCQGWRSKNQNSKFSQLSSAVTRIRKKVVEVYGIEEAIRTLWGEGYQLSKYFYHCLVKGEFQRHLAQPIFNNGKKE